MAKQEQGNVQNLLHAIGQFPKLTKIFNKVSIIIKVKKKIV